jgi:protein-L-isoaspartate(D-aspartate) O-methyltransferase
VARAFYGLPWEHFDTDTPLTPLRLSVLVRMLEALNLQGTENVLDVGTGAGYRAALLGALAGRVRSLELLPSVAASTRARLEQLGYQNVEIIDGDGSLGFPREAPFDAIVVGGASPDIPHEIIDQLAEGGRLVIPIGDARGQLIARLCRRGIAVESTTIAPCVLRPLALGRERRSSVPWLQLETG